jgi:hypothetical protein
MGLLWFAVTLRRAGQGLGWAVPAYLALAFVCLVLAEIDAATGLLPNTITYPAFPVMAGLLLVISLGLDELGRLGRGLLAAASVGGLFLLLALLSPTAWGLLARLSHGTRVVLFELSERVNCGLFRVGRWVDGAMAWQLIHCREEPETEEYQILGVAPGIFADKAAPYRAQQAQADAAGEDLCYLGAPVVELFVSLTGIHHDRRGWWWDLRYRDLKPIDRASG